MSDVKDYERPTKAYDRPSAAGNTGSFAGTNPTPNARLGSGLPEPGVGSAEMEVSNAELLAGSPPLETPNLRGYEIAEEEPDYKGRIVGITVIVLAIGAIGAFTYATGMWNSTPNQVVASNQVPPLAVAPPSLPTETAQPQQAVVPPPAPVENPETPTRAVTAPVKSARVRTVPRASRVQPTENSTDQGSTVAPAEPAPLQVTPPDTIVTPPAITPVPDTPTQTAPDQPAVQPAPQP